MNPVIKYFSAERLWCAAGASVAVISVILALWFLFKVRQPLQVGMAYPFLVLGILFFIICLSVAIRSGNDIARVIAIIDNNRVALQTEEIPRMNGVMRTFSIILTLEALFLLVSGGLLFWGNLSPVWRGAMMGLLIQAGWLFIFDIFARSRGSEYSAYLNSLSTSG